MNTIQFIEEVKAEYLKEYASDSKMYIYCTGKISNALKLECNLLIEFEKPYIKKDFCFGAGMYASASNEEMENAFNAENEIKTNVNLFIEENMNQAFGDYDKYFEELEKHWSLYARSNRHDTDYLIGYIRSEKSITNCYNGNEELKNYYLLTEKDIENLKNIVKIEKEKFLKRLNTYLKKYGLSKLNTWTYIRD